MKETYNRTNRNRYTELRDRVKADPTCWTVEKMARTVYLTRSYFYTTYKEQFGISPCQDIMNFTIDYAKKLLSETGLKINEIAEKCGYLSPNNFTRAFKKHTGITPLNYRRRVNE